MAKVSGKSVNNLRGVHYFPQIRGSQGAHFRAAAMLQICLRWRWGLIAGD